MESPLIITLKMDEASQAFFTARREKYFPKHVNYLAAHITLFHHLPAREKNIPEVLTALAKEQRRFYGDITGLKNTGNGVAYVLHAPQVTVLHTQLQQEFNPYLIRQDRQKIWPHITIQNKVTNFKAQETFKELTQSFTPRSVEITGLTTWLYFGGPWLHVADFHFSE